jgi:tetratricopeptide (TPR) repeat protein
LLEKYSDAQTNYNKALRSLDSFATTNPDDFGYLKNRGDVLKNLAKINLILENKDGAIDYYLMAIHSYDTGISKCSPKCDENDLLNMRHDIFLRRGNVFYSLGELFDDDRFSQKAKDMYEQAFKLEDEYNAISLVKNGDAEVQVGRLYRRHHMSE